MLRSRAEGEPTVSDVQAPDSLTKASIKRFSIFLKFLAANNLIDKAEDYLHSRGIKDLWISVEPIKEIQQMIQSELAKGTKLTEDAEVIVFSIHTIDFAQDGEAK
jgi:hypothetical protein